MRYLLLAVLFFCRLFPAYGDGDQYVEGDQILEDDQNMEFSYCYPEDSTGTTFSLAKNSGKVFLLEMLLFPAALLIVLNALVPVLVQRTSI